MIKLSILDQSPIAYGIKAPEALQQTVRMAQLAEELGYTRFWVSEHHDAKSVAGSTPEILIAHLGANTSHIRLGSGGVMLPHYSAYKVAENFRMLEALYPKRIDLGLGRAPGGMPIATKALQEGRRIPVDYSEQVADLMGYLTDQLPEGHRFSGLTAAPVVETVPEMWLLGSTNGSATIAAERGTAFTFAQFINPVGGIDAVREYEERFQPSNLYDKPEASVAIFVVCAETEQEAEQLASTIDLALLRLEQGYTSEGIPTLEMAESYELSPYEQLRVSENRKRMVVGDPNSVKRQIEELANAYGVNEVMGATLIPDFQKRMHCFELLAQVFNLKNG
ncbi:LLM class flavin-dependent oxidoreductase [Bacillus horti]|uniref:Luciferase family oxidoreductase group 1 n=1 Tax=Caldalkalibacillus horti TaxID=77523 RepID=A0ABT9VTP2_9BACI|nr:LLM class flavin-dependent oxidoreductase [Bacillus horti]MDQ0164347.1 luciferase family oxidoreductase group 1 [Bacillus horti]